MGADRALGRPGAGDSAAVIAVTLALVTLAVFWAAVRNGFVNWDDNLNLLQNVDYRGLGPRELRWMFGASIVSGQWIPLTWVSFGLDYVLWGMRPAGYHLTNILLHAANAALFSLVARRLLEAALPAAGDRARALGAAAAALFFALHPLRVESVAWVTERRDVLSGCFFLVTVLAYLRAVGARGRARRRWRAASVAAYALALSAKAIVVTLPLVLVVLNVYPLRRLCPSRPSVGEGRRVWVEVLPYACLAAGASVVAAWAVRVTPTLVPETFPVGARLLIGAHSLCFYLWKSVFPLGLSPLFELPLRLDPVNPHLASCLCGLGAGAAALWALRRRWPAGLAAGTAYAVLLLPVSGLFRTVGAQLVATRYSYLSCLPWALLVGGAVAWAWTAGARGTLRPTFARLAVGGAALWVIGLAGLTRCQVEVWRDTETLWRYALEVDSSCARCHNNLGAWLAERGLLGEAIAHFEQALLLRPDRADLFEPNLKLALRRAGRGSQESGPP